MAHLTRGWFGTNERRGLEPIPGLGTLSPATGLTYTWGLFPERTDKTMAKAYHRRGIEARTITLLSDKKDASIVAALSHKDLGFSRFTATCGCMDLSSLGNFHNEQLESRLRCLGFVRIF